MTHTLALVALLTLPPNGLCKDTEKVVQGHSMFPTIQAGDKVTFDDQAGQELAKGEVILYFSEKTKFLHASRIVGLSGDKIDIQNHLLFINGTHVPQTPVEGKELDALRDDFHAQNLTAKLAKPEFYSETLGNQTYRITVDKKANKTANYAQIKVPAGTAFVIGDCRDLSNDSRFQGPVSLKLIKKIKQVIRRGNVVAPAH